MVVVVALVFIKLCCPSKYMELAESVPAVKELKGTLSLMIVLVDNILGCTIANT